METPLYMHLLIAQNKLGNIMEDFKKETAEPQDAVVGMISHGVRLSYRWKKGFFDV